MLLYIVFAWMLLEMAAPTWCWALLIITIAARLIKWKMEG